MNQNQRIAIVVVGLLVIITLLYYDMLIGALAIGLITGISIMTSDSMLKSGSNEPVNLDDLPLDELIKKAGEPKKYERIGYDEVSVGLVPIDEKNHDMVLLTKSKSGFWGFSKGHPDDGEDEKTGAIRENKEEIGLKVKEKDLWGEFTLEDNMEIDEKMLRRHLIKMIGKKEQPHVNKVGTSKRLMVFFGVYVSNSQKLKVDDSEVIGIKWCTVDEAKQMMTESKSNQIKILEDVIEYMKSSNSTK